MLAASDYCHASVATMSPRPKAYSYLRFSTPEQAKGDSLRRQTEAAERYAAEHGLDLDAELTFRDLGVSAFLGRNATSGALGMFLRAVQDGVVEPGSYLLVESLDRVSRELPRKALRTLEEIVERGVVVVTLTDGRVHSVETLNDPWGLFGSLMIFVRAHEESEMKSRRLRAAWAAKRQRAKETGERLTRMVPEWIKPVGDGFELDEERAGIIRRIFAETLAGDGQHRIAERLTREEVPTWNGGRVWHRTYVRKLLSNPAVMGTAVFHEMERLDGGRRRRRPVEEVPNYFPAAVDANTWSRVQRLLGSKEQAGIARRGRHAGTAIKHLLASLARCPRCSSTMTRVNKGQGNGRAYLVCTLAKSGGDCEYRGVPVEEVDGAILGDIPGLLAEPPSATAREAELRAAAEQVGLSLEAVQEELTDLQALRAQRRFSPTLRAREAELYAQADKLAAQAKRLDQEAADAASPAVAARVKRLWEALEAATPDDLTAANAALRETFERVVVDYPEGLLRFQWRHGGSTVVRYRFDFRAEEAAQHRTKRTKLRKIRAVEANRRRSGRVIAATPSKAAQRPFNRP